MPSPPSSLVYPILFNVQNLLRHPLLTFDRHTWMVHGLLLPFNHPHYLEIAFLKSTYLSPYLLPIYSLYQFEAFEALS